MLQWPWSECGLSIGVWHLGEALRSLNLKNLRPIVTAMIMHFMAGVTQSNYLNKSAKQVTKEISDKPVN